MKQLLSIYPESAGKRELLLEAIFNNASVAIFIMDERQHCVFMNAAAEEMTGYALDELRGTILHDMIHHTRPDGSPYPIDHCPIDSVFPANAQEKGQDFFVHKDGSFYPVAYTASPIRHRGVVTGTILEVRNITDEWQAKKALEEEARTLEILNQTGEMLAEKLDIDPIVQAVTDAATQISGAQFGAFFYTVTDGKGESFQLYSLSGVDRAEFADFPMPRNTHVFGPTFVGEDIIRVNDITKDPRYGKNDPYFGMPKGHLPVRSYLAVPVISRSGEVIGGLFFGHEKEGVFSLRTERIVSGIAAQAAVALDNARLFEAAQMEIEERQKVEGHQKLLIDELNHRAKNMLATVQSIAAHSLHGKDNLQQAFEDFNGRLTALSQAHSLLMRMHWHDVSLRDLLQIVLSPFANDDSNGERVVLEGPHVLLPPKTALALGMGIYELASNASKYGALSTVSGKVELKWSLHMPDEGDTLHLVWQESSDRQIRPPSRKGFGSRLLQRGLSHELGGSVQLEFLSTGVRCSIELPDVHG